MAFDAETVVTMADGQFVAIGDIEKGDEVLTLDLEKKKVIPSKVLEVIESAKEKAVSVRIAEEITCSESQLFVMKDFSAKKAVDLRPGDIVLNETLAEAAVKSVRVLEKERELVTLKTKDSTFAVESIFVAAAPSLQPG